MNTVQNAGPVVLQTLQIPQPTIAPPWSPLAKALRGLIARARPHKIVESGTSTGLGTTLAICEALHENEISLEQFYSIEVNPAAYAQACENLACRGFFPHLLGGLSLPRHRLPDAGAIRRETVENVDKSVFADYAPDQRVALYQKETDFPNALDDLLGYVLCAFNGAPDLVVLDSAGYLGFIEFQHVLSLIRRECYIALDDVCHIKHHRSLQVIQDDPRFQLLDLSRENFGYCIARFEPG